MTYLRDVTKEVKEAYAAVSGYFDPMVKKLAELSNIKDTDNHLRIFKSLTKDEQEEILKFVKGWYSMNTEYATPAKLISIMQRLYHVDPLSGKTYKAMLENCLIMNYAWEEDWWEALELLEAYNMFTVIEYATMSSLYLSYCTETPSAHVGVLDQIATELDNLSTYYANNKTEFSGVNTYKFGNDSSEYQYAVLWYPVGSSGQKSWVAINKNNLDSVNFVQQTYNELYFTVLAELAGVREYGSVNDGPIIIDSTFNLESYRESHNLDDRGYANKLYLGRKYNVKSDSITDRNSEWEIMKEYNNSGYYTVENTLLTKDEMRYLCQKFGTDVLSALAKVGVKIPEDYQIAGHKIERLLYADDCMYWTRSKSTTYGDKLWSTYYDVWQQKFCDDTKTAVKVINKVNIAKHSSSMHYIDKMQLFTVNSFGMHIRTESGSARRFWWNTASYEYTVYWWQADCEVNGFYDKCYTVFFDLCRPQ